MTINKISELSEAIFEEDYINPENKEKKLFLFLDICLCRNYIFLQITKEDFNDFDYIFGMDHENIEWVYRAFISAS